MMELHLKMTEKRRKNAVEALREFYSNKVKTEKIETFYCQSCGKVITEYFVFEKLGCELKVCAKCNGKLTSKDT